MSRAIVTRPDHKNAIAGDQIPSRSYEVFFDDLELLLNQFLLGAAISLPSYAVADVPTASEWTGGMIYVSDESGGAVPAFSDGTNWRRTTDRAVIS